MQESTTEQSARAFLSFFPSFFSNRTRRSLPFSAASPRKGQRVRGGKDRYMPHSPRRPCRAQGCRNFCNPGDQYCEIHLAMYVKEDNEYYNRYKRDQEAQAFYDSPQWRATRRRKLQEQPCCEECLRHGIITPATIVDHITPIKQGGARLDMNNLQSLCRSCHSIKSIAEGSRFGNYGIKQKGDNSNETAGSKTDLDG